MKKYFICIALALGTLSSCADFLDRDPVNILQPDKVFGDEKGIEAYFATLYGMCPIEDFNWQNGNFNQFPGRGENNPTAWAGETWGGKWGDQSKTWEPAYKAVRSINDMIVQLNNSTILSEKRQKELLGEAKFLRAFSYFYMVKLWGGVPILDKPLEYTNIQDLMLPRNKEQEVWDFIIADLQEASSNMTDEKKYGRANKYTAMAMLSRAALYAASAAKFGVLDEAHCVGVDPTKADYYYGICKKAASDLMNAQTYHLYDKESDKVENFRKLFLDTKNNPEILWAKGYDYNTTKRTHSYDFLIAPKQIAYASGEYFSPYLETVEAFEFVDGSPALPICGQTSGARATYKTIEEAFVGRDPRLYASIILPNSIAKGVQITMQNGVWENGNKKQYNEYNAFYDTKTKKFVMQENENTVRGTGASGGGGIQRSFTSFATRKYMDEARDINMCRDWTSETDYIIIRYAEVLLNYVEAVIQSTNSTSDEQTLALQCINQVKERAGVAKFTDFSQLTFERYRAERRSELFAENHLYWDLRRWRDLKNFFTYDTQSHTHMRSQLQIYYDYVNDEYQFIKQVKRDYQVNNENVQYHPIPSSEMSKNSLFVNNPGY